LTEGEGEKMSKSIVCASLLVAVLSACAQSSGVLKMGPDTYTVSVGAAPARGGQIGAKSLAYDEAAKYCTGMKKELLVLNTRAETTTRMGAGTTELTFRCLAAGDPELQRPTYRAVPDATIEDRRN
jgi:hypothetical protein